MKYLIILFSTLIASCSHTTMVEPMETHRPLPVKVKSYKTMDILILNNTIEQAIRDGKNWPLSPALVSFNVLGGDEESRVFNFSQQADSIENPSKVTSIQVRDGFPDDSERGDWHKMTLSKQPDNTWRIIEAQKAHGCWRGDANTYQAAPCP